MRFKSALCLLVFTTLSSSAAFASLIGSSVTGTLYYPNLSTVYSTAGPITVSSSVEFPSSGLNSLTGNGSLDVTDTQIIWTSAITGTYGSGSFNGFDLLFTGAPNITNVTLDGSSTLTPVSFTFTGNDVKFNLAGLSVTTGQQTILDVTTASVGTPEPSTALLSLPLLAMIGLAWFRKTRQA